MDIRYAPQMSFLPCAQILHNNGNLTVLNRKTHEKHKNKKRSYFIRTAGFALSRWNRGYIYSPRCKPWVGWPHRSEPSKTAAYITVFEGSFPFFGYYPHLGDVGYNYLTVFDGCTQRYCVCPLHGLFDFSDTPLLRASFCIRFFRWIFHCLTW